jgi:uncharacterized protein YeaO (DUF488 family)
MQPDAAPITKISEFTFVMHIAPSDQLKKWWCVNCRNFIFFSHHRLISIAEEGPLEFLKAPITIICSKCRSHINIQTVV